MPEHKLPDDILYLLVEHADQPTLSNLCRLAKSTGRLLSLARRQLYQTVRLDSLHALEAFCVTVQAGNEREDAPGSLVIRFCEQLPGRTVTETATCRARFTQLLSYILSRTPNVRTVALANIAHITNRKALIGNFVARPRLRNICLPGMLNITELGNAREDLEHICVAVLESAGLSGWLSPRANTLRYVCTGLDPQMLLNMVRRSPEVLFPNVHTITTVEGEQHNITPEFGAAFPALRSLSISRVHPMINNDARPVSQIWPKLQHLEVHLPESERPTLDKDHQIHSLRVLDPVLGLDLSRDRDLLLAWASPAVQALSLGLPRRNLDVMQLHEAVLGAYHGLLSLDVEIPTDFPVATWAQAVVALPALQDPERLRPDLRVLTLRTGDVETDMTALVPLRTCFPDLRLVRVIRYSLGEAVSRLVWPASFSWRSACESVAQYLPHWSDPEMRPPWADVTRI